MRSALSSRRPTWTNAPIVVKGLMVASLPVVVLVVSSVLVLLADRARVDAYRHAEAAERVNVNVGRVRSASEAGVTAGAAYFSDPDDASLAALKRYRDEWEEAVVDVEDAAIAQKDAELNDQVHELRTGSDELNAMLDQALLAVSGEIDFPDDMTARADEAQRTFDSALDAISRRVHETAERGAAEYYRQSDRTTNLMLVSAVVGIIGTIAAMIGFALAMVRRVRLLEVNARALGEGRPLAEVPHAKDELGELGRGLDRAAALLSEREQALADGAETLRRSQQKLALALEAGAMGTWDVDLVTGRSEWDERSELDHGLEPGTFGGSLEAWLDVVHPDDRTEVLASGTTAMVDGGRWRVEYRTATTDGATKWIGTSGWAIRDESGTVVRLVGVGTDITERRESDDALRAAIDEAERANHAKSEFLSRVSHELRTPLNAILGFGQLLEMEDLTAAQQESVDQVLHGGRHLLGLIDDVLDISCIESGNLALSVEPVAIGEVISETVALVSSFARERQIHVELAHPRWNDVHVHADRRRLKQILVNLLSNAIKYNVSGGKVELRCSSPSEGVVRVAVADTGIGIPADRLARLFTPFDRLGAEHTAVDGIGIGLALSHRLAEMLGTTLAMESVVGGGSTFWLDLELTTDPVSRAGLVDSPAEEPIASASAVGRTILYIEDNPSNLRLVQRLIDPRDDLHLVTAATGTIGLATAARLPLDLILLDLHLPDLAGEQVLARLREAPETASTPIAVVTADVSPGQAQRLRAAGADAFLTKPLDLPQLVATIDELLMGTRI